MWGTPFEGGFKKTGAPLWLLRGNHRLQSTQRIDVHDVRDTDGVKALLATDPAFQHLRVDLGSHERSQGLYNKRVVSGGLDPGGVRSANLGRPIFAPNLRESACFKGVWGNFEAKMGRPNLQIQRPTDPTPHLKPSDLGHSPRGGHATTRDS